MNSRFFLLVEDNSSDVELTRRALGKSRITHEMMVVEDGLEALDYLFARSSYQHRNARDLPAFVLLDLNLPRVDGLEVLRQIRENTLTRRLPVVVLTTSKEGRDITQSYHLGANSYIRKPVDFKQFAQAIAQLSLYWLELNEPAPL